MVDKKKEKKRLKKVCFERNFVVIFAAALEENKKSERAGIKKNEQVHWDIESTKRTSQAPNQFSESLNEGLRKFKTFYNYNEEFDPGSGWTLAGGLTHASRAARQQCPRAAHGWVTRMQPTFNRGIAQRNLD